MLSEPSCLKIAPDWARSQFIFRGPTGPPPHPMFGISVPPPPWWWVFTDFSVINPLVCNVTQFIPIATKYYRQSETIQEAFQKDWSKGEKNQEIKIQLLCANPEPDGTRIIGINTLLKHCPSGEETADPVRDRFRVGRD